MYPQELGGMFSTNFRIMKNMHDRHKSADYFILYIYFDFSGSYCVVFCVFFMSILYGVAHKLFCSIENPTNIV